MAEPKRRRKKKAEPAAKPTAEQEAAAAADEAAKEADAAAKEAEAEERQSGQPEGAPADETASAEEVGVEAGEPEQPTAARSRRRAAEVTAGRRAAAASRRGADGTVEVRAHAKYVRTAPRKARLVIDHIRGKSVDEARAILSHTPRAAAEDVLKLLNSCVANAENNHELVADELRVARVYVDEGPTLKRYRPRALGRATRIRKRTSHMTITLTPKE